MKIRLLLFAVLYAAGIGAQDCQSARLAMAPMYYSPENLRSDTFDILRYTINLEIGDAGNPVIRGNTAVRLAPKISNRPFVFLDLLKMNIDSVKEGNALLTYIYDDTLLKVNFAVPKNVTDTSIITIYYNGAPVIDATGWGGFYFDNTQSAQYAYNLGVGFGAAPHNYGRVWFPCFDNFVERSRYEFNITTDTARKAYCNGALTADNTAGVKRTRQWQLNNEIPTYLASVAVAKYTQVNWQVNTLTGPKPIVLAAHPSDTTAMKAGFVNLPACIAGFENYFGPYKWNRFGYCLVPFSSGAMEHPTNIAYPKPFIGNLAYEADLMAHELSHHWWGDLVTCETQEDMWINEGMATYASYLFLEWKYGKSNYTNKVKSVHEQLVHFLQYKEGFRAISGVPHALTYGDHVYKKGAEVAHNLRAYLGDSLFFAGLKAVLQQKQWQSMNSLEFRNLLQTATGVNLTDFFNDWVLSPGWSHFVIDSTSTSVNGASVTINVSVRQKSYGTASLHNSVPLEISLFRPDRSREVRRVMMNGMTGTFALTATFTPAYIAMNYDGKLNDATTFDIRRLKQVGGLAYNNGKALLQVRSAGGDTSLVRVVHHYVKPDPFKYNPAGHKLSDQHYWTVEGIFDAGLDAGIRFNYDGTKNTSGANAYLDTMLTAYNGDSIQLFYRADARDDWKLVTGVNKVKLTSKTGFIEAPFAWTGEYAFGNLGDTLLLGHSELAANDISVYPNPASKEIRVRVNHAGAAGECMVYDAQGRLMVRRVMQSPVSAISTSDWAPGTYIVNVISGSGSVRTSKVVIQ